MKISKYHGTGNDFVFWEDLADEAPPTPELVAALCDRHRGVGADGVIRVSPSERAPFFMDYWNADGTLSEMCGNGIRCLAKLVYDRGLTDQTEIDVDTRAGVKRLQLETDGGLVSRVRVDMGTPAFGRPAIGMHGEGEFWGEPIEVRGERFRGYALSTGNPHLVLIGDADPRQIDVPDIGPLLEAHDQFKDGANVEFLRIDGGVIHARVWERGVGETMACGTGASASLVAAARAGLVPRRAPVIFPGGELDIEWAEDDHVFLTGPATFVFDAELDPAWVAEAKAGRVVPVEVTA